MLLAILSEKAVLNSQTALCAAILSGSLEEKHIVTIESNFTSTSMEEVGVCSGHVISLVILRSFLQSFLSKLIPWYDCHFIP